jgi:hypothetical protein
VWVEFDMILFSGSVSGVLPPLTSTSNDQTRNRHNLQSFFGTDWLGKNSF